MKYPAVTPVCLAILLLAATAACPATAGAVGSATISGQVPLVLYNSSISSIGSENATITWKTNGAANSTVDYGLSTGYGSSSTDQMRVTSHSITLYHLTSGAVEYHYRVRSTTADGQSVTGSDGVFKTQYASGSIVSTQSQATSLSGTTATTVAGVQSVSLNRSDLSSGGGSPAVSGNTVTVTNPGTGWSSAKYTAGSVTDDGKNISITSLQSVALQSTPVTCDLGGNIGSVSTQISVSLKQLVTGVPIEQKVIAGETSDVAKAFQVAASSNNLEIKSVAYTVEFTNTGSLNDNLGSDGVTLNLSVDHAWVEANGGRDAIKILRSGEDGRKEPLPTQYKTSSGSTDYFEAVSSHGLSVFGIAAVASTGGDGGNTGGGNTGGEGSSGGSSDGGQAGSFFSSLFGAPAAPPPAAPPVSPQRAPYEKNVTVTTRSLSVAGLTTTTDAAGIQTFYLTTGLAEQSGANVTIQDNVITISQPGFALTLETRDIPLPDTGHLSGTLVGAGVSTAPAYAHTDAGNVSVAVSTPVTGIPENAVLSIAIPQSVKRDSVDAFRSAAESSSGELTGIAYSASVDTLNLTTAGPTTVTMTISPEWVQEYGGITAIRIARVGDDGTTELLATNYSGTDTAGNLVFTGVSPKGFSTFGLVSVKYQDIPVQVSLTPASASVPAGTENATNGIPFVGDHLLLILGLAVCAVAGILGIVLYSIQYRKPAKKDSRKR